MEIASVAEITITRSTQITFHMHRKVCSTACHIGIIKLSHEVVTTHPSRILSKCSSVCQFIIRQKEREHLVLGSLLVDISLGVVLGLVHLVGDGVLAS